MTVCTAVAKCALVKIRMTGNTARTQSQECLWSFTDLRIFDELSVVALCTVELLVCTRQRMSGQIMIKTLLIESHHVEVSPVMFAMTFEAILPPHFP
jgi:hypothetical protein